VIRILTIGGRAIVVKDFSRRLPGAANL